MVIKSNQILIWWFSALWFVECVNTFIYGYVYCIFYCPDEIREIIRSAWACSSFVLVTQQRKKKAAATAVKVVARPPPIAYHIHQ